MEQTRRKGITEKFGKIIEVLQYGYVLADREGNIIDVNSAYCDIIGYSKKELLSMNLSQLLNNKDASYQEEFLSKVIRSESTEFEIQHITKNGEKVDLSGSATTKKVDGEMYLVEFLSDVTKRKEEQRKRDAIFNSMFQFIGLMQPDGTLLEANKTALGFGGISKEDVIGNPFWEARWWQISEETQRKLKESIKKAAAGEFIRYEVDVLGKDDVVETIDFSIKPVFDDQQEVELLIPEGRVITNKKKVENELKKSEQQLNSLFEHNPLPVYLFDLDGRFVKLNDKLVEFTGQTREALNELGFEDFIHEDDLERTQGHFQKALLGETGQYEIRVVVKDDEEREVCVTKFPMYEDGEIAGVYGILEDITEQKKAERKLEDTKNRFQSLFKNNPHPVYYFDLEGNFMGANKRTEGVSGYLEDELLSMNFAPIIVEEDLERTQQHFESAASGSVEVYEIEIQTKQNEIIDLRVINFPMRDGEEIVGVFGIAQDITEQKELQEKLMKSEKRWQHLVEMNPQPVQVTINGEIVFINKAGAALYGADSPEEITGSSVFEFSHPGYEDKIAERKYKLENNLDVESVHEHKIMRLDGESRFIEVNSIPIEYQGQKAIQTVINDITERKNQERIIRQSLKEKEVLLKEIHHRVKNNMAVVSGLLQLQAMNTDNDQLTEMLEESQLRIYSMAMIHEKLYQTETLSEISCKKYIKELVEVIKDTFVEDDMDLKVSYDIDDLALGIDQAIPCALILNELVVNCLKHAFSDMDQGQIIVGLRKKDDKIKVRVQDNGKGLPKDFDIDELQTLGMSLIKTLAAQLEGEVGYSKNKDGNGIEFFVKFSVSE